MAARGYPRFTVDIDLLTADARVLDPDTWADLVRDGAEVETRRGDADDPLADITAASHKPHTERAAVQR